MAMGGHHHQQKKQQTQIRCHHHQQEGEEERDMRHACGICLEPYWGRSPKILPCHHTYCLPCLTTLSRPPSIAGRAYVTGVVDTFPCPTCRAPVVVPPGGVASLQTNFYVDHEPGHAQDTRHHDVKAGSAVKENDDVTADLEASLEKILMTTTLTTTTTAPAPAPFTNVFVKNFANLLNDRTLREMFAPYGAVLSATVAVTDGGGSRGFGFVSFERPESARRAVAGLNKSLVGGRTLHCAPFQSRAQRTAQLKDRYEGLNVYVKNLEANIDDDRLRREFAHFGTVTGACVMTEEGRSKGFGFVSFSSPEEARKAVTEMNGRILETRPLYVALAQRKEDRRSQLASRYVQHMANLRQQQSAQFSRMFQATAGNSFLPAHQTPMRVNFQEQSSGQASASDPRAEPHGTRAFNTRTPRAPSTD